MDGVGDAWGDDDGLDLGGDVETPAIGDEDMDGLEGDEEGNEEGGWEMEVCISRHFRFICHFAPFGTRLGLPLLGSYAWLDFVQGLDVRF